MNLLDTRDLYTRQCELQEELDDLTYAYDEAMEMVDAIELEDTDDVEFAREEAKKELEDWKKENQEELDELDELEVMIGNEWMHGETLIPEQYFVGYAKQLAEDMGVIDSEAPWPLGCIDWDQAADELMMDYTSAEFQGKTYLFRS